MILPLGFRLACLLRVKEMGEEKATQSEETKTSTWEGPLGNHMFRHWVFLTFGDQRW